MRKAIIVASAVGLASLLGMAGVESAYAARPVTCGQYLKTSHAHQRAAFARVTASLPPPSLATGDTATSGGKSAENTQARPKGSSVLVAACEAASPDSTVADAYRHTLSNITSNAGQTSN